MKILEGIQLGYEILKIYFLGVEKFCGKVIFPSAPVCCILNDRSLINHFNRYLLELVSTYLCTYQRTEEFIIMLANYVVS